MIKNILVLNVGSSSVKYAFFSGNNELLKGNFESVTGKGKRHRAVRKIMEILHKKKLEADAIAHRVVHGKHITKPRVITKKLVSELKKIAELAPLHEIPEIEVIETCIKVFDLPQVAVFDTAFFHTLPEKAAIYGLPYKYYKRGIRKYGFHGISHAHLSRGLKGKVITCHLGNGCSISAVKDGKCIDTSMGFTPLDGLVMSTRSGSLDPAIIPYLMIHEKIPLRRISELLNQKSGLLGISGKSYDLRNILRSKSSRSKLAVDVFVDRVVKQIGSYIALMNGVNTLVFSAGIGEGNAYIRKMILDNLVFAGVKIDERKNKAKSKVISSKGSKVKVLVKPADEELEIAREARILLRK